MKHIYYRNDFAVEVELFNFEGVKVSPPEWKWSIEFSDSRKKYVCSLEKGNAEAMAINAEFPYNMTALHNECQALRDKINKLEKEVNDAKE